MASKNPPRGSFPKPKGTSPTGPKGTPVPMGRSVTMPDMPVAQRPTVITRGGSMRTKKPGVTYR